MSGFYVVTAYLGAWLVRAGAGLAGIRRLWPESSPSGNFAPVAGDKLARSIAYGFADAHADDHALPEIRDSILYWHLVFYRGDLPPVHLDNHYVCVGGMCRHSNTPAANVRREAMSLLAIAEHLDSGHE